MPPTVAERTREAVRSRPALYDALRVGVVNYAAAADLLELDADPDAVATALRRFAADLPAPDSSAAGDARVTMDRGVGPVGADEAAGKPVLTIAGTRVGSEGDLTAVRVAGDVGTLVLERVLARLRVADVDVRAAGVADEEVVVIVGRRDGATALRLVEATLEDSQAG